ncbi:MAG: ABC transporter ATP-binding protein [Firmicutes bacterium]|nr:ABC transporter ATP-binding protein [Bacillota bacterium]
MSINLQETPFRKEALPVIYIHKLCKKFRDTVAVHNLHLEVQEGELFCLAGPDGAGKTTTVRLILGLIDPEEGEVYINGRSIRGKRDAVIKNIGYVPQKFSLYEDLTVKENLKFFGRLYNLRESDRKEKENELLEFAGLQSSHDRLARNLSGGMKQKLSLICTLIHNPGIIFLDEPTSGLDPLSRRDFWALLHHLLDRKVTIFLTTSRMEEADYCHRMALMDRGSILMCDSPSQIKSTHSHEIIEVTAEPVRKAKEILSRAADIQRIEFFGDRLHITLAKDRLGIQSIREILENEKIKVEKLRKITPGLEDIFLSLSRGEPHAG